MCIEVVLAHALVDYITPAEHRRLCRLNRAWDMATITVPYYSVPRAWFDHSLRCITRDVALCVYWSCVRAATGLTEHRICARVPWWVVDFRYSMTRPTLSVLKCCMVLTATTGPSSPL